MAAVLETAGYIYQARILADLKSAFEGSLGGFVFLVGIVVAITTFAVKGAFKQLAWLLIGPPMFFAVILPTSTIDSAQWRFGNQDRNQSKVLREVTDVTGQQGSNIQVSKLFARYVKLIGATQKEMITRLNRQGRDLDRTLVFRGDLLSMIYSAHIDDDAFYGYLHDGFFHQCRMYINAAAIAENPQYTAAERGGATDILGGAGYEKFQNERGVRVTPRMAAYLLQRQAGAFGNYNQIAMARNAMMWQNQTCQQVWNTVRQGLRDFALRRMDNVKRMIDNNHVDRARLLGELDQAVFGGTGEEGTAGDTNRLVRAVMKFVLRNEYLTQGFVGEVLEHQTDGQVNASVQTIDDYDLHRVETARTASMEWSEKTRMMSAAENLPYYQGLALFFLGMSFPFFAMLLLVPGKHAGFILWFVLWLWVKSWDIGITVVALLDRVLFQLLGYHQEIRAQNNELPDTFGLAMYALKNMDPSFQMTTYYNILATCILSIPVISSQVILGSLTGGAGLVAAGMGMIAQQFAGGALVAQQQTAVSELRFQLHDLKMIRAQMENDAAWNRQPNGPAFRQSFERAQRGSPFRRDAMQFGAWATEIDQIGRNSTLTGAQRTAAQDTARRNLLAGRAPDGGALPAAERPPTMGYPVSTVGRAFLDGRQRGAYMRSLDTIRREAESSAALNALMAEATNPTYSFNMSDSSPVRRMQNQARTLFNSLGGGRQAQLTTFNNALDEMQVDSSVLMSWLLFDTIYSAQAQELAGLAKVYGMLEVPWTTGSAAPEDDAYLQGLRRRDIAETAAVYSSLADLVNRGVLNVNGWGALPGLGELTDQFRNMQGADGRVQLSPQFQQRVREHVEDPFIRRALGMPGSRLQVPAAGGQPASNVFLPTANMFVPMFYSPDRNRQLRTEPRRRNP